MALDPSMRASDADREAVAAQLRDGYAEGRLTDDEFEGRLEATYAARTMGELVPITRDLPQPAAPVARPLTERPVRAAWAPWVVAVFVCTTVWLVVSITSGELSYFWPMWVAGPWGGVLLARTLTGAHRPERPGRRDGERDHR